MAALDALTNEHGLLFGGDYNPDQWPSALWLEDVSLMRAAHVTFVTVGVFSWSRLEPREGLFDFDWLDEVLDLLAQAGIGVDLATPTAAPPPWLGHRYPETLPVTADGHRLTYGSRNQFCPASDTYRDRAVRITRELARRYTGHPALRMWHVGNELGHECYCDADAAAFRIWLHARYGSLDALNEAWGTNVWSQRYGDWEEIQPPRRAPYVRNPAQILDFRRFASDQLFDLYRLQRDAIREYDHSHPVTTNLMGFFAGADYRSWAGELDVIADDAYPDPTDPNAPADAALTQSLMRSLAGGGAWMLMEHATSAVSWRPHNLTVTPERARMASLQAVARGADGICFFQWRQSRAGAERFHSAMVPIQGPDTTVFAGVARLGADLMRLRCVVGTTTPTRVALLWDWDSWWASTLEALPSDRLDALAALRSWHRALWRANIAVNVVASSAPLADHAVVFAPALPVLSKAAEENLRQYVHRGGTLVCGPFSAIADQHGSLYAGRFPAPLRDVFAVSGEQWMPLPDAGIRVGWTDGFTTQAHTFAEHLRTEGARALGHFIGGDVDGCVAIAENRFGAGNAWYVGAHLDDAGVAHLVTTVLSQVGVAPPVLVPNGVEVVLRGEALFVFNRSDHVVRLARRDLARALGGVPPHDLIDVLSDDPADPSGDSFVLAPNASAVVMETRGVMLDVSSIPR